MPSLMRKRDGFDDPTVSSALVSLVGALPELYQPIYGHEELSESASRECADRLADVLTIHNKLSGFLRRPLRVLDLGCAQGFFSLHLAALGATVHGVDFLASNIAVCKALAGEHPKCRMTFELGDIQGVIERIGEDEYDLVLGLSVFHHMAHERGAPAVRDLLTSVGQKVGVAVFEMALREEPVHWAISLPASPRELLQGFAFVHRTQEHPTHLSEIRRPVYFASNRYWLLDDQIGAFDRFTTASHPGARGVRANTRLYYFGAGRLVKMYLLDNPLTRETNLSEIHAEAEFLRSEIENFRKPRLLLAGKHRDEAWLVRELFEGALLSEVIRDGLPYDPDALLNQVLDQLVILERNGLYHGDLRTWNVLVDETGLVTLIDYGGVGNKRVDCAAPQNIFLAFLLFVREVSRGKPGRVHGGVALPTFSPDELPEPYRTAFWSMLATPPDSWSFARLLKDIRAPKKHRPGSLRGRAGFQATFRALEECGEAVERAIASRTRMIQQFEDTARRAEARETELKSAVATRDGEILGLRQRSTAAEARTADLNGALAGRDAESLDLRRRVAEAEARAAELNGMLAARDAETQELQRRIAEAEARAAELNGMLAARDAESQELQRRIAEAEARAAELNGMLAARNAESQELQRRITEGEARAAELNGMLAARDAEARGLREREAELSGSLTARDAEIFGLAHRIRDLEASGADMGKTLGERAAELSALGELLTTERARAQDAFAGSETEQARLRKEIAERDLSLAAASKLVESLRQQINALHRSTSWRITEPLRATRGWLGRIRRRFGRRN